MSLQNAPAHRFHTSNPQSDPDPPQPGRELPDPPVPPDMEPVAPVEDPPPGRGSDGEPPPVIAGTAL
ncbi:MAG: hypothetical protein ACXW2I_10985, partial [Burkholderiales bacterium]